MVRLEDYDAEIIYPIKWIYKVIGLNRDTLRDAVADCITGEYTFRFSHASLGGKYQSYTVEVLVKSETERLGFFNMLSAHPDILRVI